MSISPFASSSSCRCSDCMASKPTMSSQNSSSSQSVYKKKWLTNHFLENKTQLFGAIGGTACRSWHGTVWREWHSDENLELEEGSMWAIFGAYFIAAVGGDDGVWPPSNEAWEGKDDVSRKAWAIICHEQRKMTRKLRHAVPVESRQVCVGEIIFVVSWRHDSEGVGCVCVCVLNRWPNFNKDNVASSSVCRFQSRVGSLQKLAFFFFLIFL